MSAYISYLTPASWKQAQKNKSDLEATNPTDPVLNEQDEQFLERITSQEGPAPELPERQTVTVIADDGKKEEVNTEEENETKHEDEVVIPATQPQQEADVSPTTEKTEDDKIDEVKKDNVEEVMHGSEQDTKENGEGDIKEKVEEEIGQDTSSNDTEDKMTKSWASYLPSLPTLTKKNNKNNDGVKEAENEAPKDETEHKETETTSPAPKVKRTKSKKDFFPTQEEAEAATQAGIKQAEAQSSENDKSSKSTSAPGRQTENVSNPRTWSSYIPSIPAGLARGTPQEQASASLASAASSVKKGKQAEEAAKTAEDDEKEVSVLLDRLNLSAINNRVFSFSQDSQKVYQSFTVVLKDIIAGGPTAYEDLEKLIEENKEQLEKMFSNMPPFVQTLVKSLPAKFGSALGPEVLAAMTADKPGADMQARMAAASSSSDPSLHVPVANKNKKQKRNNVPSAKSLVSEKGAVAGMLRNILTFLKARFPAFVTGTNILMSLAVFILLFVFWYCHKRGKQVRLLAEEKERDMASANVSEIEDEEEDDDDDGDNKEKEDEGSNAKEKSEGPGSDIDLGSAGDDQNSEVDTEFLIDETKNLGQGESGGKGVGSDSAERKDDTENDADDDVLPCTSTEKSKDISA